MSEWKDASSYMRGERGTKEASAWDLDLDGLRVSVHRMHGVAGDWFGSCHAMGIERHQLAADELDLAKCEFLGYLEARAKRWVSKLSKALVDEKAAP